MWNLLGEPKLLNLNLNLLQKVFSRAMTSLSNCSRYLTNRVAQNPKNLFLMNGCCFKRVILSSRDSTELLATL